MGFAEDIREDSRVSRLEEQRLKELLGRVQGQGRRVEMEAASCRLLAEGEKEQQNSGGDQEG